MSRVIRLKFSLITGALLAALFTASLAIISGGASPAQAQDGVTCDDPFDGPRPQITMGWPETDFCQRNIELREVRSGGVGRDGIPPIDEPVFTDVADASETLQPQSPVIALEIDGDARAYPLEILTWHEIVNDVVGDQPVAVTYCPLCNSAIVFDRVVDGETLRFGVSGLLRNSDLVMWDSRTSSWWQQITGEGLVGFYTDTVLDVLPSLVVGFADFAAQYPDGQVLTRDTGYTRSYGQNPYVGYDSSQRPFLFDGDVDERLPALAHVLGALVMDTAVAYPYVELAEVGVVNDTIADQPVVVIWSGGVPSALDGASINDSRQVGTAALYSRLLDDGDVLDFYLDDDGTVRDAQTDSAWNQFGQAVEGALEGARLYAEIGAPHFWFAWAAFRPETTIWFTDDES